MRCIYDFCTRMLCSRGPAEKNLKLVQPFNMGGFYGSHGRYAEFVGDCDDCGREHWSYGTHEDEPLCPDCVLYQSRREAKAEKAAAKAENAAVRAAIKAAAKAEKDAIKAAAKAEKAAARAATKAAKLAAKAAKEVVKEAAKQATKQAGEKRRSGSSSGGGGKRPRS